MTKKKKWTFEDKSEDGNTSVIHRMNGELTMGENLADLGGMVNHTCLKL